MAQTGTKWDVLPCAKLRPSTHEEFEEGNLSCVQWECHGCAVSADGPTLVLCDGIHFQRLSVLAETAHFLGIDLAPLGTSTRRIREFYFLRGRFCSIFMVLESGQLLRALWPQHSTAPALAVVDDCFTANIAASSGDVCIEGVVCAAVNQSKPGLLCVVGMHGHTWLISADGFVRTSGHFSAMRNASSLASLPDSWLVLSCTPQAAASGSSTMHTVHLCDLLSLELRVTVRLGCAQISHVFSWCQTQLKDEDAMGHVALHTALVVADSPPLLLPVELGGQGPAAIGVNATNPRACVLAGVVQNDVSVEAAAALFRTSGPLIALGLSDGSVLVLRGSLQSNGCIGDFQVAGRHQLISSGQIAPVIDCGFAIWTSVGVEEKLALFAASASGKHQLWITKAPASEAHVSEVSVDGDDMPRTAPAPTEETCIMADVAEIDDEPLPPRHELADLIRRTALEIEMLEHEQQKLIHNEEDEVQSVPEPTALPAIDVPDPPKISRIARAQCIDPKWARKQQELVDPTEITRAYLDRACRPQGKVHQPHWIPSEFVRMHKTQQPWESAVESFSVDPLEAHVKSLCQPW